MKDIPAFPNLGDGERYDGLTLRDYLAAKVLPECYRQSALIMDKQNLWPEDWCHGIAHDAYRVADAMLAERSKGAV